MKNIKQDIRLHFLFLCAVLVLTSCQVETEKPNIIMIVADDLGWNQVSMHVDGFYETPNIDALAENGMRFTNAYSAAPVCSPTRSSIMTGKHPARLHLTTYIPGTAQTGKAKLLEPEWQKYLALDEITIAEALKEAGYKTATFGKWHLSKEKLPPVSLTHNPDKQGFDEHFVTFKPSESMKQEWQTPENDGHSVKLITDKSLKFIDENKDNPFFLLISHNSVHTPLMEKEKLIAKYKAKPNSDEPQNHPVIAAMMETMDINLGRVVKKIEQEGLSSNTIIIFYSDNGGLAKDTDMKPFRAGKATLYEGGIRVPMVWSWPGKIAPGTVVDDIVNSTDFMPTFLDVVGSKKKIENIDGVSLINLLTKQQVLERNEAFWHFPHYHHQGIAPSSAVRSGRYKLIEWLEKSADGIDTEGALELFDLIDDPGETTNLVSEKPELVSELYKKLDQWRLDVGAQEMVINQNIKY